MINVLLIEADSMAGSVFSKSLVARGLDVQLAPSATAAIRRLRQHHTPDVIVWDFDQTDIDVATLLQTLEMEGLKDVPLIVISALALNRRVFGMLSRANHVLLKPFNLRGLTALVASVGMTPAISK